MTIKVAIYARISTDNLGQDVDRQLHEVRAYCERMEYEVVDEYVDEVKSSLDKYRINIDNRNVRLGEKLHNSEKLRTPIQMIIGENDKENSTVALNFKNLDNEKDLSLNDAIQKIADYLKEPEFNLHG